MEKQHEYSLQVTWTGNRGTGTSGYAAFDRSHSIEIAHKAKILGSSDPAFRGDKSKHNPEELLLASLSSCHMLWYLHLCAVAGIIVTEYTDIPSGIMTETADGGGRFTEVTLHPAVTLARNEWLTQATQLHKKANTLCFIANSVNFPVRHAGSFTISEIHS